MIDINTGDNYQPLIDSIKECECVITSTLHGMILALVYYRRVIFTEFSDKVVGNHFKFDDFFESLKINYTIPKYDDKNILTKFIHMDRAQLRKVGLDIIATIPFIEADRRDYLRTRWNKFTA
jgi:pyruvyltransferase